MTQNVENNGFLTIEKSLGGHPVLVWHYGDEGSLSPKARKKVKEAHGAADQFRSNYVSPKLVSLDETKAFYDTEAIASAMSLRVLLDDALMNEAERLIKKHYPETYEKEKNVYEIEVVDGKKKVKKIRKYRTIDNYGRKYRSLEKVIPIIKGTYFVTGTRQEHLEHFTRERSKKAKQLVEKIFSGQLTVGKWLIYHKELAQHPAIQEAAENLKNLIQWDKLSEFDPETKTFINEVFHLGIKWMTPILKSRYTPTL